MARLLDAIVVVDVEATCWDGASPDNEKSEIIEIGVCLLHLRNLDIDQKRSYFVIPEQSSISDFCTQLTGITPETVADKGMSFDLACHELANHYSTKARTWASWGDYDRIMFERQCSNGYYPFGKTHLNVKNLFAIMHPLTHEMSMDEALEYAGLSLEGRHHQGSDDAYNIAKLLRYLIN